MRDSRLRSLALAGRGSLVAVVVAAAVVAGVVLSPPRARGVAGTLAAATLPASAAPARGIDVSSFQHPGGAAINWRSVARAGYRFAFIKATEGSYYVNPYFTGDAAAAKKAGLLVAAYHFANPADSSGVVQADYALGHGGYDADGQTLRLILDIEPDPYLTNFCYGLSPAQMVSWIAAFMGEVHRRTGLWPVINTQPRWWDRCTANTRAFAADQLWVQWDKPGAAAPVLPSGWKSWDYWQYSDTGRVPGITGDTDLNVLSPALLAAADPCTQSYQAGHQVRVLVRSVNASAGQSLSYVATGLPSGLSENPATGVITGTLSGTVASTRVTLTVSAAGASPVTFRFSWYVHGKVTLTDPATQPGAVGGRVRLRVKAADGLSGCTLRFTATGLPPGLSINSCGLITGRLRRAGTYRTRVRVTDSSAVVLATAVFGWKVT